MPIDRPSAVRDLRRTLADRAYHRPRLDHLNNGEEAAHPGYVANHAKCLPHNDLGEVDPGSYRRLLRALCTGAAEDFERVPLDERAGRKLADPQAGLAYCLVGEDAQALTMPPAPRLDSPESAVEMAELYWMALCRDVPFSDFGSDETAAEAAKDLATFPEYWGAQRARGDTASLFRGFTSGDARGPYISQFLLRDVQFGTFRYAQRQDTVAPGRDYVTDYPEWLAVLRGEARALKPSDRDFNRPRYLQTPRDLAHYVHFDGPYDPYLTACLILFELRAPVDPGNPYLYSRNQAAFATHGNPHILSLLADVALHALRTVWYQKWFVHRRLRPEELGGPLHHHLTGRKRYDGVVNADLLNARVVLEVQRRRGTYLLPQAYPEGSPTHPAYGAGHAAVAGACVTVLKAWFDEAFVLPDPVQPDRSGTKLVPYGGPDPLSVGGELNKLAGNVAIGRNFAGVHWYSDYSESVKLGERVAIAVLRDDKDLTNNRSALTVTLFDGRCVTI